MTVLEALQKVVRYMWQDEQDHYESDPSPHHIWHALKKVSAATIQLEEGKLLLVDRKTLEECCELAHVADEIEANDADDANGGGDWDSVYDDARKAAQALREIRRQLHERLHATAAESVATS
jgi:hypothetical protein